MKDIWRFSTHTEMKDIHINIPRLIKADCGNSAIMKKHVHNKFAYSFFTLFLIFLLTTIYSCTKEEHFPNTHNVIPEPVSIQLNHSFFDLNISVHVAALNRNPEAEKIARRFIQQFKAVSGIKLGYTESPNQMLTNAVLFEIIPKSDTLSNEAYFLEIDKNKVHLKAQHAAGLFRGLQTIYQLMPPEIYDEHQTDSVDWKIGGAKIFDQPRFQWRGMHLDVSRHFFDKEFSKRYIDLIAMHKMNVFHWHLTDDNGWRIEIDQYPKLTEIAAWRVDRSHQSWNERTPPEPGEKATYGGFYTKDDIREIVQYAAERHINVLPEIEMPGHTSEVLAAYPELGCTGEQLYVQPGGYWPNVDIFCAGNEQTFVFLENVLDEVMELFPFEYIHIGGDEATKTNWEKCPKCQKRIKDEGLADEHELQSWFIRRMEKFLNSKGRKLIGWDEILEGGLAPEATVMSWRGFDGGIQAARQGNDVIMSPVSHCYFDYYQANPQFEPEAIGGFTTLKKVYSFDPVPPELTAAEAKHVLGGQGNVWTEYIPTPEHAEYMSTPRMTALAEVLWSPKQNLDWNSFLTRLQKQFDRFNVMGVNYSLGSFAVDFETDYDKENNRFFVKFNTEQLNPVIRFTTDGSTPDANSELYNNSIAVSETTTIRAAIFTGNFMNETFSEKTIVFHAALGADVEYKTQPSHRYPGIGSKTLTDGLKGSANHRDGLWQGFYGDDLEVVIDLGNEKDINAVSGSFIQRQRSWIFMPVEMKVALSQDGVTFSEFYSIRNTIDPDAEGEILQELTVDFPEQKARFVKVIAKNIGICPPWHRGAGDNAWLFADEIVVMAH